MRAVVAAVVLLGGLGWYFFSVGQDKAEQEAQLNRWVQLIHRGDLTSLKTAASEAGQVLSEDATASGAVAAIDSRAQLLIWMLYSGADQQRYRATQSLDAARARDPIDAEVKLSEALWEVALGDPGLAVEILDAGTVPVRGDLASAVRAEAHLRAGDPEAAQRAVDGASTPLGRMWRMKVAWRAGDLETTVEQAAAVLETVPTNEVGQVMAALASARSADGLAGVEQLGALIERDPPLTARNAAIVTVELSRLMRRAGKSDQADQLLEQFLAEDEGSTALQQEYARVQRFKGLFGAAKVRADKALRAAGTDPGLLGELSAAAFFNDAPQLIRDRIRANGPEHEDTDGGQRALAVASLIEGNSYVAIEGLKKTRHIGVAGDAELWLSEAYLQVGDPAAALIEARRAVELLLASTGEGSREVATARMYEGLAIAAGGDQDAGRELMAASFVNPNRTPWGAWLYGRFHELAEDPRSAKDAYLLACHNGQDFSLSCFDLARLYDSLPASGVHARTQREAREHYLRTSPKGWHADEVRAALDR